MGAAEAFSCPRVARFRFWKLVPISEIMKKLSANASENNVQVSTILGKKLSENFIGTNRKEITQSGGARVELVDKR